MASAILNLPVELQIEILSHLPFDSQILASKTCTLWNRILNTAQPSSVEVIKRYTPDQNYGTWQQFIHVHKFLTDKTSLTCTATGDTVHTFQFHVYNAIYFGVRSSSLTIPDLVATVDITDSIFLDDPLIFGSQGINSMGEDVLGSSICLDKRGDKWATGFNLYLSPGTTVRQVFETAAKAVSDDKVGKLRGLLRNRARKWVNKRCLMNDGVVYQISMRPRVYYHRDTVGMCLEMVASLS
ncbi:hypothetical protein TWF694_003146 [Orbilia ellipsospora]|uniref:F-box domain-containing protein n=1 Tax=Orbilia ellipsospora TaxID=2528407 RepID=A0AAV9X6S5_9PEZI